MPVSKFRHGAGLGVEMNDGRLHRAGASGENPRGKRLKPQLARGPQPLEPVHHFIDVVHAAEDHRRHLAVKPKGSLHGPFRLGLNDPQIGVPVADIRGRHLHVGNRVHGRDPTKTDPMSIVS